MIKAKNIASIIFILVVCMSINVYGQDTPAKSETPPTESAENAPRVKSPIEQATYLCTEAESQKKLGRHDDAIAIFTEALEKLPEHYPAFVGRAGTKFLKLDFQSALADYDAAITMMENLKEKHETQAKIKKVFGDVSGEKIELDYVNEILPALAEAYYQRGNVKQFMDDQAGACEDVQKAKELGSNRADDAIKTICAGL
ncbi:MAG: hypothetical protein JKY53_02875 [Flavobacteriales bacterium]|nr:hypothetical protein [Flavobacteriales bacterium]